MKSPIADRSRVSFDFGPARPLQNFAQVKHLIGSTSYSVLWTPTHTYPCYLIRIFRTRSRYATYSCKSHPVAVVVDPIMFCFKQSLRPRPSILGPPGNKRPQKDVLP